MKRKLTLIVVDDEPAAIDRMMVLLAQLVDLVVKATFTDPKSALDYLAKNHVDFVLLDMEMPLINGKAFIIQMPKEIKVMLCTGHSVYATDGFDLGVVDFLLKPVGLERLAVATDRMRNAIELPADSKKRQESTYYYFMLKGPKKHMRTKVDFDELVYIEAYKDGSRFFLSGKMTAEIDRKLALKKAGRRDDGVGAYSGNPGREKLYELEEILQGTSFMRMHRSFILNMDYLDEYSKGKVTLKGLPGIELPTGDRKNYPDFFDRLDNHNLPE
jgi:Response regulator of the LytR/AlgR family